MVYVLIRHEVRDFDDWKPIFDEHDDTRIEHGQLGYQLLRGAEDDSEIVLLTEFDSVENAQAFMESDDLRERMETGGVVSEPEIVFLDEVEQVTSERISP